MYWFSAAVYTKSLSEYQMNAVSIATIQFTVELLIGILYEETLLQWQCEGLLQDSETWSSHEEPNDRLVADTVHWLCWQTVNVMESINQSISQFKNLLITMSSATSKTCWSYTVAHKGLVWHNTYPCLVLAYSSHVMVGFIRLFVSVRLVWW